MDFLTIDMVKMHSRFELYDPDPERQAEIDRDIKEQANMAEQVVYLHIGRNYSDIIKEWGEVPPAIEQAALILTVKRLIKSPYDDGPYNDGNVVKMLLRPYKKQPN